MLKGMRKVFFVFLMGTQYILCPPLRADDRIIAWVDNEVITQKQMDYEEKEGIDFRDVLEVNINQILLQKHALELGITASDDMVLERIEEIKDQFPSPSLFFSALQNKGMNEETFKKKIKDELTRARFINLLKERQRIPEDELLSNFDKWQSEIDVDFLEFKSEKDANNVFLELTKNGTTTLEIKNTGFFCYPEMKEEFSKIAFKLDEGKISHPFKMEVKFYIIKRGEKRQTSDSHLAKIRDELFMETRGRIRKPSSDENRDDINNEILSLTEEKLKNEKFEEYMSLFLEELRKSAYIKIGSRE